MVPEPSTLRLATRRTRSSDGTVVAYYSTPPPRPEAPVLVLAGGLGGHHRAWSPQIAHLGDRFRIVTWDYRGLFGSSAPAERSVDAFGMPRQLRDLEAVLEAEHVERFTLVGWSLGVQVALEAYARMPERIEALVLLGGTAGRPMHRLAFTPGLAWLLRRAVRLLAHGGRLLTAVTTDARLRKGLVSLLPRLGLVATSIDPELVERLVADLADLDVHAFALTLQATAEHDASFVLPTIAVPTLLVAGDRDPLTPRALVHEMGRRIPDSEVQVVPGAGHYLCVELPDLVNHLLDGFFARVGLG
jgi:pimeloyl-ACP methyl ester carboxylesterase